MALAQGEASEAVCGHSARGWLSMFEASRMAAAGMRRELSQRARFEKATSAGSGSVAGKRGRWVAIVALETCGRATAVR